MFSTVVRGSYKSESSPAVTGKFTKFLLSAADASPAFCRPECRHASDGILVSVFGHAAVAMTLGIVALNDVRSRWEPFSRIAEGQLVSALG